MILVIIFNSPMVNRKPHADYFYNHLCRQCVIFKTAFSQCWGCHPEKHPTNRNITAQRSKGIFGA